MDELDVRPRPRATQVLLGLLALAFVVSVVHYVDYADHPQPRPNDLPAPSAAVTAVSWFLFTASGLLGLWWWLKGRLVPAAVALTATRSAA